jgi:hypothetical protein
MFICEWHIDVLFGRQAEAVRILEAWNRAKFACSPFSRATQNRILVGHIGSSPSHIVDTFAFDTVADFEAALAGLGHPTLKQYSEAIAPLVVPGSQHWQIRRVVADVEVIVNPEFPSAVAR